MRWVLAAAVLLAGCLGPGTSATDDGIVEGDPGFRFLPSVLLPCPADDLARLQEELVASCGGFGEPVLEVRGDGQVWVAGTNGASRVQRDTTGPVYDNRELPLWTSNDGGRTFVARSLEGTEAFRALFGSEGDLAVDAAGAVYFLAMTGMEGGQGAYLTKFEADGTYAYSSWVHLPNYKSGLGVVDRVPYAPLVDRPWVRAGAGATVHAVYNIAIGTNIATSVDGGRTFDPSTVHQFPCALMVPGQGRDRETLYLAGCPDDPRMWVSRDGAATWSEPLDLPMPSGGLPALVDDSLPPVVDAAGTV